MYIPVSLAQLVEILYFVCRVWSSNPEHPTSPQLNCVSSRLLHQKTLCFVSVNTPTKTRSLGAGKVADLMYWDGVARMIVNVSFEKILVEKSTFPIKTAEAIEKIMTHDAKDF